MDRGLGGGFERMTFGAVAGLSVTTKMITFAYDGGKLELAGTNDPVQFYLSSTAADGDIPVPAPGLVALMGLGLLGLAFGSRRRQAR